MASIFKKLSKKFKKILSNPIVQFAVVAAIAYFTVGAGAGASGSAAGGGAGGAGGAAGGAAGAGTATVGAGEAAVVAGETAGNFATQQAAQQAATQQAGTLAAEQVATNTAAQQAGSAATEQLATQSATQGLGPSAADHLTNQAALQGVGDTAGPGLLQRAGAFVEKNPMASAMMFQAASSAMSPDEVDLMREQERIRRDRWRNMGVPDSVGFQPSGRALYHQDGRPVYDSQGIISRGMQ